MNMLKFVLFAGLFLLCGFVSAEPVSFGLKSEPMYVYNDKEKDTKDEMPKLEFYLDLSNLGFAEDVFYNVNWEVIERCTDDTQAKNMTGSVAAAPSVKKAKLAAYSKVSAAAPSGEKTKFIAYSPAEIKKDGLPSDSESEEKIISDGRMKIYFAGQVEISYSKWPGEFDPDQVVSGIHYTIEYNRTDGKGNVIETVEVADFTVILKCYWSNHGAVVEPFLLGVSDNKWEKDFAIGDFQQDNRKVMRSLLIKFPSPKFPNPPIPSESVK